MNYPESLKNLIDAFKLLPGVGEKTAERYAFSIIDQTDESINQFLNSLKEIKENITTCPNCGCLSEKNNCSICNSLTKSSDILCVVENQKSVFLFEKNNIFSGKYHVLGGLISPIDGINPEDLNINKLLERIKKENVKEIILALKPSIEGETTALYIKKIINNSNVKVSRIAQGIPMGTDMEYLDKMTLELALENRNEIS